MNDSANQDQGRSADANPSETRPADAGPAAKSIEKKDAAAAAKGNILASVQPVEPDKGDERERRDA